MLYLVFRTDYQIFCYKVKKNSFISFRALDRCFVGDKELPKLPGVEK